nr:MAG: ORF1 [Anelloviridae sp.]
MIKFKLELIRGYSADYLFRLQMHRGPQDYETPLLHPAHLLNMPFVTWVESVKRTHCCKNKILRRRPGLDYTGWYDMETFRNYELFTYMWTVFDPNNPMGKNPTINNTQKWWAHDWLNDKKGNKKIQENMEVGWYNRNYDSNFVKAVNKLQTENGSLWDWIFTPSTTPERIPQGKHTPFLPPVLNTETVNTLWFRYKIYFQVGGGSISRISPGWPLRETVDTTTRCGEPSECNACIKEGDTDEKGILTDEALERITGTTKHRQKHLVAKLARIILQRRKRKRVHWEDEEEEAAGPSHAHTQKRKIKCLRYLATRLGL